MNKYIATILLIAIIGSSLTREVRRKGEKFSEDVKFPIEIKSKVGEIHPEYPWLNWGTCSGFEDPNPFIELLAFRFQEVPTAGRGQWMEIDIIAKQSFYFDSFFATIKWQGVPFWKGPWSFGYTYEAGVSYTIREYAYLKVAPSGNYTVNASLRNEFGEDFYCLWANVYVRKNVNAE